MYDSPEFIFPEQDSVVYVPCDHIGRFFYECEGKNPNLKFIIISANSDYGPVYQAEHPVWMDMKKWFDFQPVDETLLYNPLMLPSRCNNALCKITDKYSVKMHVFTQSTFNKIPNQIKKWYSTNTDINEAIPIPFGIPDWSENLITEAIKSERHLNDDRDMGFYINFQNNTAERVAIKNNYGIDRNLDIHLITNEVSHEQYIENLLNSVYVLSPSGNGLDCYRTLESLYCGAIPLLPNKKFTNAYSDIPLIRLSNFGQLEKVVNEIGYKVMQFNLEGTKADFGYWRKTILLDRQVFLESGLDKSQDSVIMGEQND